MTKAAQVLGGSNGCEPSELEALLTQVQALCSTDANGLANNLCTSPRPGQVQLHYIAALARRLQAAPPAVQQVLKAKLAMALASIKLERVVTPIRREPVEGPHPTFEQRRPMQQRAEPVAATPSAPLSLLAQLNQHIQATTAPAPQGGVVSSNRAGNMDLKDLRSTVRFRETWARISAETELDQAGRKAPENAGPLNAHNLVLRTLGLMRELSPDYLRRFMSHTESLLWMDQAYGQLKQPAGKSKSVKAVKPKK